MKKLSLKKEVIATLTQKELSVIFGGEQPTVTCPTNTCFETKKDSICECTYVSKYFACLITEGPCNTEYTCQASYGFNTCGDITCNGEASCIKC